MDIEDRNFDYHLDQKLQVDMLDSEYPIVSSLNVSWSLEDETYTMADPKSLNGAQLLLGPQHYPSMRVLEWSRQLKQSRVFYNQSGHDHTTYANALFRTVLERGIR